MTPERGSFFYHFFYWNWKLKCINLFKNSFHLLLMLMQNFEAVLAKPHVVSFHLVRKEEQPSPKSQMGELERPGDVHEVSHQSNLESFRCFCNAFGHLVI